MTTSEISIGPSRWFYALGAGVILAGVIVFVVLLVTRIPDLAPDIQLVMPGTHEIQLSEAGNYTIFYEYRSVVENRVFASSDTFSGMSVLLRHKESLAEVVLSSPSNSATYEIGGRAGVSMLTFEIEEPGSYIFSGQYGTGSTGQDVVFAIGKFSLLGLIAAAMGSFFGGTIIGAAIIIITLIKRRSPRQPTARIGE